MDGLGEPFFGAFGVPRLLDTITIAITASTTSAPIPAAIQIHGGKPLERGFAAGFAGSLVESEGGTSILPLPLVLTAGGSIFFIPPLGVLPLVAPVLSLKIIA